MNWSLLLAAGTVTLTWSPNPANQRIAQYRVYEQMAGKNYVQIGTSGSTSFKIVNVSSGFHTYAVSAFNLVESPLSKPDKIKVP